MACPLDIETLPSGGRDAAASTTAVAESLENCQDPSLRRE